MFIKINLVLKFLVVLSFISRAHLYPNYDECADKYIARDNVDPTLIFTRSGSLRGMCYSVVVNDPVGTKTSDVLSWLGVPYAQPPVNENRFKPPKPVESWRNIRDATQLANQCQSAYSNPVSSVPVVPAFMSEDCLYLNIHVPAAAFIDSVSRNNLTSLLPILVYIHGGGFEAGSATNDLFDPSTLVAYSNVIVVTINYRLGVLGYMAIENTEATGNAAFLDQNMALKWIHENAISFGGDPSRITISGESAGAFSVSFHLVYEKSWPYYRNAILLSGSAYSAFDITMTIQESTRRARDILGTLGCSSSLSPEFLLKCAQSLPASSIFKASSDYFFVNISESKPFSTLINSLAFTFLRGGDVFKADFNYLFQSGKFKNGSLLLGFDRDEAGFFLSRSGIFGRTRSEILKGTQISEPFFRSLIKETFNFYPAYSLKPSEKFFEDIYQKYLNESFSNPLVTTTPTLKYFKALISIIGEMVFICPIIDLSNLYAKANNDVFLYLFDYRLSTSPDDEIFGIVHTSELPLVFGEPLSIKKLPLISANPYSSAIYNYSVSEREFSKKVITYLTNFVKYNNPSSPPDSKTETWPKYQKPNSEFLVLNAANTKQSSDQSVFKCDFWRENSELNAKKP